MLNTLSDTHRVILANAAAQENLRALPIPSTLRKDADAIATVLAELVRDGLLVETPSDEARPLWPSNDDTNANLLITNQGMLAIGITLPSEADCPPAEADFDGLDTRPTSSKLEMLVALLQRPEGADIDELMLATGWQKHSVRGAMSGALKKQHNHQISSVVIDGRGRVYRIDAPSLPPSSERTGGTIGMTGDEALS